MSEKMNDQEAVEFAKIVYGWMSNGLAKSIAESPLFKWEQGMKRDRNGHPCLNDTVTVALLGEQARRFNESEWVRRQGGYVRARAEYRVSKTWTNNVSPVHITPIASGWKIKGLDTDDVEHAVVAERVWQTEGQAWACAWILAAYDAVIREGGIYNGEQRDGLARCREIFGIPAHEGDKPVPLSVTEA